MELESPLSPAEIVQALATASRRAGDGGAGEPEEIVLEPGPFQGHIDQHGFIVVLRPSLVDLQFAELAGRIHAGERGSRISVRPRMSLHGKVVIALFFLATLGLTLTLPKRALGGALLLLLVLLVYPLERMRALARLRRALRA